jgi:hypothetical protein
MKMIVNDKVKRIGKEVLTVSFRCIPIALLEGLRTTMKHIFNRAGFLPQTG